MSGNCSARRPSASCRRIRTPARRRHNSRVKIQLLSDLHLEAHPHYRPHPAPGAELLVLAGDIDATWAAFDRFRGWPVPVLAVAGNHEFDGRELTEAWPALRQEVLDADILDPRRTWSDKDEYDRTAAKLVDLFVANFAEFAPHVDEGVRQSGPAARTQPAQAQPTPA